MARQRDSNTPRPDADDRRSAVPGAPQGYPETGGPTLPRGVPEPGELPSIEQLAEPTEPTDSDIYTGDLEAEGAGADPDLAGDTLLNLELRPDETTDPIEASEEGIPFVPPIDPVIAGVEDDGDPVVASGFSASALDEPYDESHHGTWDLDEDEMVERIRDALRADAQTTAYAEALQIVVVGGRAAIAGTVADLEDADAVIAVAERVSDIREVEDRMDVRAADETGADPRGSDEG
jgi:hypothetical protein